jgi:hypothetical protein
MYPYLGFHESIVHSPIRFTRSLITARSHV